jgi:hypothetical protein
MATTYTQPSKDQLREKVNQARAEAYRKKLILWLKVGDPVQTPNGPGTYQGRWWDGKEITHIIVKHQLTDCKDENLVDIALQLSEKWIICYYPINDVEPSCITRV